MQLPLTRLRCHHLHSSSHPELETGLAPSISCISVECDVHLSRRTKWPLIVYCKVGWGWSDTETFLAYRPVPFFDGSVWFSFFPWFTKSYPIIIFDHILTFQQNHDLFQLEAPLPNALEEFSGSAPWSMSKKLQIYQVQHSTRLVGHWQRPIPWCSERWRTKR